MTESVAINQHCACTTEGREGATQKRAAKPSVSIPPVRQLVSNSPATVSLMLPLLTVNRRSTPAEMCDPRERLTVFISVASWVPFLGCQPESRRNGWLASTPSCDPSVTQATRGTPSWARRAQGLGGTTASR